MHSLCFSILPVTLTSAILWLVLATAVHVAYAGVGHCPMDEAPDLINPAIMKFVSRHTKTAERVH